MENTLFKSSELIVARNHMQQLKMLLNLPVRLISENQVLDVLPLEVDPLITKRKKIRVSCMDTNRYPTPDELIDIIRPCRHGDLLTTKEVAHIYNVSPRTIWEWARQGCIPRIKIASSLSLYKRQELPTIEQLYGPYEL